MRRRTAAGLALCRQHRAAHRSTAVLSPLTLPIQNSRPRPGQPGPKSPARLRSSTGAAPMPPLANKVSLVGSRASEVLLELLIEATSWLGNRSLDNPWLAGLVGWWVGCFDPCAMCWRCGGGREASHMLYRTKNKPAGPRLACLYWNTHTLGCQAGRRAKSQASDTSPPL